MAATAEHRSKKQTLNCANCGASFEDYPSNHRKYCSVACSARFAGGRTHGMSSDRLYTIWRGMHSRCKGTANKEVNHYYHDRGITVCEEWKSFEVFRDWAFTSGYDRSLELDRKNNNEGYSPANCRWATHRQQMANTRKRRKCNTTSKFKGVQRIYTSRSKPWRAIATMNRKPKHLGCFATEEEAARAYDEFARQQYGEFAATNFDK